MDRVPVQCIDTGLVLIIRVLCVLKAKVSLAHQMFGGSKGKGGSGGRSFRIEKGDISLIHAMLTQAAFSSVLPRSAQKL